MRRSSPRKRAREADADACCAFGAATRARHALEAESQQPAAQQPQPETSSGEDSCSTTSTDTCGDEVAPVAAAAPTKRRILRHFETAILLSTSAARTAEREKVVATLTAAGESELSGARGRFLEQRCANATLEERAFVDERLQRWFAAGAGGDFKELFDTLEEHGRLSLSEARARCMLPRDDQPRPAPCPPPRLMYGSYRALHVAPTTAGRTAPPTSRLARIGAKSLRLSGY